MGRTGCSRQPSTIWSIKLELEDGKSALPLSEIGVSGGGSGHLLAMNMQLPSRTDRMRTASLPVCRNRQALGASSIPRSLNKSALRTRNQLPKSMELEGFKHDFESSETRQGYLRRVVGDINFETSLRSGMGLAVALSTRSRLVFFLCSTRSARRRRCQREKCF